jgi:hypothetical protein
MSKFIPTEGLNRLTEDQRKEYYLNACSFLQVPPELGLLYYRYVDTGDAGSQLQLLVKRGACEIIRQNKQISVSALNLQPNTVDYISYQAVGKTPDGRQEIAIGSQTTKNVFAKDIANADMAASTKALIRLTLQFAGGGFLWEGEVGPETAQVEAKPVPAQDKIAATPVPTVAPVLAPGKDITPKVVVEYHTSEPPPISHVGEVFRFNQENPNKGPVTINGTPINPMETEEQPTKRKYTRKSKAVDLNAPQAPPPAVGDEISLPGGQKVVVAQVGEITPPVPPRAPISQMLANEHIPESRRTETSGINKLGLDLPDADQLRGFRARNAEYSGVFLKQGGMQPAEGIGGTHAQLTMYWMKCIPNFTDAKLLTKAQWIATLDKLDEVRENEGLEGLVKHVQKAIGIQTS